jgi:hypothetical protein
MAVKLCVPTTFEDVFLDKLNQLNEKYRGLTPKFMKFMDHSSFQFSEQAGLQHFFLKLTLNALNATF